MNVKLINIGYYQEAIERLEQIKKKNYGNSDIKVTNLHLRKLNSLLKRNVFFKNDAFISAETLYDIMCEESGRNKHNYHSLSTEDVYKGLRYLSEPICIVSDGPDRYSMISSFLSSFNIPILVVVDIKASLVADREAEINKIVTMFPRDDVEDYIVKHIASNTLLYKK